MGAQIHIGFMYAYGTHVAEDFAEAAKWFRKAAEQGDSFAEKALGIFYEQGRGVAQDYSEAAR